MSAAPGQSLLKPPRAVFAVAFACVVSFMGIGPVDPILPALSAEPDATLGLGIAAGPLLGGFLGNISWRGPFFGVAVLMAIALPATVTLVEPTPKPATPTSPVRWPTSSVAPPTPSTSGKSSKPTDPDFPYAVSPRP
ncbi:MFS transporter [Actinoplanes sp. NPDC020271]|uniref:MFS transporter n=1 Tax=Actinoplanes sp. NPDC020271 TaxID=3363896 RepID=UPI0037BA5CC3